MVTWAATTAPGLEGILRDELARHGLAPTTAPVDQPGWVAFQAKDPDTALRGLLYARTLHRIGPVLAQGSVDPTKPREGLTRLVEDAELAAWLDRGTSFAARCNRRGTQAYTSMDVEPILGSLLQEHTRRAGGRPPQVDLEEPGVVVRVEIDPSCRACLWVDLVGYRELYHRGYRDYQHRSSMKGTIAAALLDRMGWQGQGVLVDPTAGGGTLVIEAAWRALGVPAVQLRRPSLLLWNTPTFRDAAPADLLPLPAPPDAAGRALDPKLVLADVHAPHLDGARENLAAAGVAGSVRVVQTAVAGLPEHVGACWALVANPPYGLRNSNPREVAQVHRAILEQAAKLVVPEGRVGLLTPRRETVRELAGELGFRLVEDLEVQHGRLPIRLMVLAPG